MSATTVTITLGDAEQAALDAYIRDNHPQLQRADALAVIVSDWARARTAQAGGSEIDQGMRPDQLNASNDI